MVLAAVILQIQELQFQQQTIGTFSILLSLRQMIHHIHRKEWEADQIEAKLSKELFNIKDLDPVSVIHLLKIVDRMDQIANHAENAGDWLRAMLAK